MIGYEDRTCYWGGHPMRGLAGVYVFDTDPTDGRFYSVPDPIYTDSQAVGCCGCHANLKLAQQQKTP